MHRAPQHRGAIRRRSRTRSFAWSLAGVGSALALIFGSLAGLDREVLSNDQWHRVGDAPGAGPVVLAPGRLPAPLPGATAQGPVAQLGRTASPALTSGSTGGAAAPRATAPTAQATGGQAAPGLGVRLDEPVVHDPGDGRVTANGFKASKDTDRDGLTDVRERRLGTDARRSDSDDDGLPDGWEVQHGLNPTLVVDAREDADGDGLPNVTEFRVRSNPQLADTDANGQSDGEEDTDGDGVANVDEVAAGTDPAVPDPAAAPAPAVTAPEPATLPEPTPEGEPAPAPESASVPQPDAAPASGSAPAPEAGPAPQDPPADAVAPATAPETTTP